ncbi:hypothetical protein CONCODRAFT_1777 [Conidiobolus coronatus NRRL 28638]|uniref:Uncharacterized protein n=1 Tax=Conidiobolus coronatus (strain ATCC 28846 / CBS 209.66 / NRRL 28638) TaxID=796925 RepID=A0A137PJ40_CONC2|nr:hypothetical protein CONCODRAFT_1777 [Conidiobolus coronatus NRRL 28638]|eukprot:KXN74990.1 hypothetical protein CONCODRAFT_1777 [Conidiobolus coronatus NRRL 28638]
MDVIQYHFNEDWEEVYTNLQEKYCVNLEASALSPIQYSDFWSPDKKIGVILFPTSINDDFNALWSKFVPKLHLMCNIMTKRFAIIPIFGNYDNIFMKIQFKLIEGNLDIQLILASSYFQYSMLLNNIFKNREGNFQEIKYKKIENINISLILKNNLEIYNERDIYTLVSELRTLENILGAPEGLLESLHIEEDTIEAIINFREGDFII